MTRMFNDEQNGGFQHVSTIHRAVRAPRFPGKQLGHPLMGLVVEPLDNETDRASFIGISAQYLRDNTV